MSVRKCEYAESFLNIERNENVDYFCPRNAISTSTFCEFHDPNFLNASNETLILNMFMSMVKDSQTQPQPLVCIGYHLPAIDLRGHNFHHPVYFVDAKFHDDVDFTNAIFTKSVNFSKSTFEKKASFSSVEFREDVIFSDAKFDGERATFQNIACNKKINFSRTDLKNALFTTSTFGETIFRSTVFDGETNFWNSTFKEKADFINSQFGAKVDFSYCAFASEVKFQNIKFGGFVNFQNVIFSDPKTVSFDGNLSNVSFMDTDITRIKFGEKITWGNDAFTIYDAEEFEKEPSTHSLGKVLSIYRNLRENYEFNLRYDEAGKFFIKEMDLRRQYSENPEKKYVAEKRHWSYRYLSLRSFYSYLCNYGESFNRPVILTIAILTGAILYNWHFPDQQLLSENGITSLNGTNASEYALRTKISIERTLSAFFQIDSKGLPEYVVRVLSIPILGSIFIVLRRRFERRFRH